MLYFCCLILIQFKELSVVRITTLSQSISNLFNSLVSALALNSFFVLLISLHISAQDIDIAKGKSLYNANCASCHKLNKKLIGPALKGVSAKYDKEWLYAWIKNSAAMIKAGDEQAIAIYEEFNNVAMNAFPQLSN